MRAVPSRALPLRRSPLTIPRERRSYLTLFPSRGVPTLTILPLRRSPLTIPPKSGICPPPSPFPSNQIKPTSPKEPFLSPKAPLPSTPIPNRIGVAAKGPTSNQTPRKPLPAPYPGLRQQGKQHRIHSRCSHHSLTAYRFASGNRYQKPLSLPAGQGYRPLEDSQVTSWIRLSREAKGQPLESD